MNLLEQYIVEVHGVEKHTEEWTKKFDEDFVEVDVTSDCYGSKKREKIIFSEGDWAINKERGYWMA